MVVFILWVAVAALSGQIVAVALMVADGRTRWRWLDLLTLATLGLAVLLGRYAWGWIGWALVAAILAVLVWRGRVGRAVGREYLYTAVLIWRRRGWVFELLFVLLVLVVRLAATRATLPAEFAPVLLAF